MLAGIAPPDIRRDVCAKVEKKNQKTNVTHSLHGQIPAERRLKRKFFLSFVRPLTSLQKSSAAVNGNTGRTWHHTTALSNWMKANGNTSPWTAWICLNRLRTGVSCNKDQCKRWKYFNGDRTSECGQAPETTKHMLQCTLLAHPCTLDDLQKFNENARKCVDKWKNAV